MGLVLDIGFWAVAIFVALFHARTYAKLGLINRVGYYLGLMGFFSALMRMKRSRVLVHGPCQSRKKEIINRPLVRIAITLDHFVKFVEQEYNILVVWE